MATSAGEVEVKLSLVVDEFSKQLAKAQKGVQDANDSMMKNIKGFALSAGTALAALGVFLKSSLDAYGENQIAVSKLTNALQNQGIASQALVDHLTGLATALQNVTGTSDEVIIEAQTMLTTFGLTGTQLDATTKTALDLSAALGIDLHQAATLLGKAFVGETGMLSRYGIVVNKNIDSSQKFASVMAQVNSRFGGAAAAQADSFTGKMAIMAARFNDLQEAVGSFVSGPGTDIVGWLNKVILVETAAVKNIDGAVRSMGGFGNTLKAVGIELLRVALDMATRLIDLMLQALGHLPLMGTAMESLRGHLGNVNKELNGQLDKWQATSQEAERSEKRKQAVVMQTKEIILQALDEEDKTTKDKMAEELKAREKQAADLKAAQIDFANSFIVTEADMWNFATEQSNAAFTSFGDGFAKMITEGESFGDVMKNIWHNLTQAILAFIGQMIAKMLVLFALKSALGAGFGGGAAGIGSVFEGMMANGGVIAEPSVITGLRSGRSYLAGESGPEYVVPAGSHNQDSGEAGISFGQSGGGGGGSIVINITGQFIEGNESAWQRLMRERIVPEIRRYTMVNPTGNFNRRRGAA
ncbi:MAG: hypothetical protein UMS36scaffold28_24 [Phage 59_13]|nr:MAG: hypothetical protein UMS36scaffold28_24 [Phage 59_13]